MPSENAFKKQAEATSKALKAFVAVQNLKSTIIIKAAMTELVDATVGFNAFVPFFVFLVQKASPFQGHCRRF